MNTTIVDCMELVANATVRFDTEPNADASYAALCNLIKTCRKATAAYDIVRPTLNSNGEPSDVVTIKQERVCHKCGVSLDPGDKALCTRKWDTALKTKVSLYICADCSSLGD